MVKDMDEVIRKQNNEIHKQWQQMIERDAQIQAQSTRLSQFISARERRDFFEGAHPDFEEQSMSRAQESPSCLSFSSFMSCTV